MAYRDSERGCGWHGAGPFPHASRFPSRRAMSCAVTLILLLAMPVSAQDGLYHDEVSASNFGGIGLLQNRTARMLPAGMIEFGGHAGEPNRRLYALVQPFDWLELNFSYTNITNLRRDGTVLPLDRTDFLDVLFDTGLDAVSDRAMDVKVRLVEEGTFRPEVSVGLQDILGRGRFSGEYVVASKRLGPLDFSGGLGWGYFGSRNHFGNPFSVFGNSFKRRNFDNGGGTLNFNSFFSGTRLALFGGVEWFTPIDGLSIKAEYSGAEPAVEPFGNELDEDIPLNVGLAYQPLDWLNVGLAFERGNTLSARMSVRFDAFDPPALFAHVPSLPERPVQEPDDDNRQRYGRDSETASNMGLHMALRQAGIRHARVQSNVMEAHVTLPDSGLDHQAALRLVQDILAEAPFSLRRIWLRWQEPDGLSDAHLIEREALKLADRARALVELSMSAAGATGVDSLHLRDRALDVSLEDAGDAATAPDMSEQAGVTDLAMQELVEVVNWHIQGRILFSLDVTTLQPQLLASLVADSLDAERMDAIRIRGRSHIEIQTTGEPIQDGEVLAALAERFGVDYALVSAGTGLPANARRAMQDAIYADLRRQGITAAALAIEERRITVWIENALKAYPEAMVIGRAARVLDRHAGPAVTTFGLARVHGGSETYLSTLQRDDLVAAIEGTGSVEEIWLNTVVGDRQQTGLTDAVRNDTGTPRLRWGVAPVLTQHIGRSEESVYFADLSVDLLAELQLSRGISASGALRRFLFGNIDTIETLPTPGLPQARSDAPAFSRDGRTGIPYLQLDYHFGLTPSLFGRVSAGLFEQMYGGVGGELLYLPQNGFWALSGEVNWVAKRDSDMLFGFQSRDVVTGDISLHTEWAADIQATLRGGRFLAGDWGGTLDVSREFSNGMRLGGFVTLSTDSREEFGASNPDKGLYISMPLGMLWPFGGPRDQVEARFTDLVRDSGQRLRLNDRLYDRLGSQRRSNILDRWNELLK